jgi:hypothetical protein
VTRRPTVSALLLIASAAGSVGAAQAQGLAPLDTSRAPPFTATLSNTTPLVIGMNTEEATQALGTKLKYLSGRPGDEIFLTFRNIGGSGLFGHKDRLYLQFRQGRLAGWKGDWGHNWMWQ